MVYDMSGVDEEDEECHRVTIASATSLSTAALRLKAGGLIFEITGKQESGIGWKVPVKRRMVELSCTSMSFMRAEHDQIGEQYSATE
jgi:hypothetical protein